MLRTLLGHSVNVIKILALPSAQTVLKEVSLFIPLPISKVIEFNILKVSVLMKDY